MKRQTLKRQIFGISSILIIATILLYVCVIIMMSLFIQSDVEVHNESMMTIVVDQLNERINLPLELIENVDYMIGKHDVSSTITTEYLETIQISYPYFESIHIVDDRGFILNSAPYDEQLIGSSVKFEPYFLHKDDSTNDMFWSEVYISRHTDNPTISVTIPEDGYYIAVDLDLHQLPIELDSKNLFEEIYSISVLDKWGTYIIADDRNKVLERQRYPHFEELKAHMILGESLTKDLRNTSVIKVEGLEWYIVFEFNQATMYRGIERLSFAALLVWIFIIAVTAYLLRRYFKYIYRDIRILSSKADHLASTDLNLEEGSDLKFIEFEEFEKDFNEMANNLAERDKVVKDTNIYLDSLVKERTHQLEEMNTQLEEEIMEKEKAQEETLKINEHLEEKVKERTKELEFLNGVLEHEVEKAEEANKAKGKYISIMAHEMRTPLNGMNGFLQLLKDSSLNQEQTELTTVITESTRTLLDLINDILDVERFAAGKMSFSDEPVELNGLLRKIIEPYRRLASKKNIELKLNKSLPDNMYISIDSMKLEQVFNNLLSNAIKFTEKGRICIDVNGNYENQKIKLDFRVEDTGIGISQDVKPQLFKPFAQANASITKSHGGSGLGLMICKEIVEHYEGHIDYESSVGIGTIFYGHIYVGMVLDESIINMNKDKNAKSENITGYRNHGKVLVAEDNIVNQKLMKKFFEKNRVDYQIVDNGEEAVKACESGEISLVLMDCQMPIMDGIEATKLIRDAQSDREIKIIAMTAYASKEDKRRCIEAGMDEFISEPVDLDHLETILGIDHTMESDALSDEDSDKDAKLLIDNEIQRLMAYIHFDYETTSDLLYTFIKQMKNGVVEIEQQMKNQDYYNASRKAHQLKGAAGAVRNEELRDLVVKLENVLNEEDSKKAVAYINQIKENPLLTI